MDIDALRSKLKKYNQEHLLTFWDDLTDDGKKTLINDISSIDLEQMEKYIKDAMQSLNGGGSHKLDDLMQPLPSEVYGKVTDENTNLVKDYESEGLQAISQGKVAVLLLAGGQGTRLGVTYPKGMFVVDIPSGKSLFQLQAERIRRLQQLAADRYPQTTGGGGRIQWYIMTSAPTRLMTEEYFSSHSHFGLSSDQVHFFMQGTLPCVDFNGKIILEQRDRVARAPDGNGGVYSALGSSGQLRDMVERGVQHVHVYCVDNILVRVADPHFIGYCASRHSHAGAKVVVKREWSEPVGVLCSVNGSYQVVEYSEITPETAKKCRESGKDGEGGGLMYDAGNICNHYLHIHYLRTIVTEVADKLSHHVAKKKIPHVSLTTGHQVKPAAPNGIKMEKFVFDVFPYTKSMSVWEVCRESEFCPLKNADPVSVAGGGGGVDCPAQCAASLLALHARWLRAAGATILPAADDTRHVQLSGSDGQTAAAGQDEGTVRCEVSPLLSYGGEGLEALVSGKTFRSPVIIFADGEKQQSVMNEVKS